MNSFTAEGTDGLKTISPRIAVSYVLTNNWSLNASVGRYYKIPAYTILGYADNTGVVANKNSSYQQSDHYVAGIEFLPNEGLRFTAEGFYKKYDNVPVSIRNGIALSNLGSDFNILGNEAVTTIGKGKAYGFEIFAQKKLTKRFFGILSYTFYRSKYSGADNALVPSSWDNKQLLSIIWGYKFRKNWELGLKFRYQGGAPYTPYADGASQQNYLSLGQGIFDYSKLNKFRLKYFNASDVRIDKKWNLKRTTIDVFIDVTNWYAAKNPGVPSYTFKRNADNTAFVTTDTRPIKPDGSNGIPVLLKNDDASVTPSIGFIIEF
jgi:outer membrane receptor for ferrienterochelin and colicin